VLADRDRQLAAWVRSFSCDGAGNVTADTGGSTAYNYVYNNRNRLAEFDIGSTVTADYTGQVGYL
jgi:hypothetical protein